MLELTLRKNQEQKQQQQQRKPWALKQLSPVSIYFLPTGEYFHLECYYYSPWREYYLDIRWTRNADLFCRDSLLTIMLIQILALHTITPVMSPAVPFAGTHNKKMTEIQAWKDV